MYKPAVTGDYHFSVVVTPKKEQPFSSPALRYACREFAPRLLPQVCEIEKLQGIYDASDGKDLRAAVALGMLERSMWHIIFDATSHEGIRRSVSQEARESELGVQLVLPFVDEPDH